MEIESISFVILVIIVVIFVLVVLFIFFEYFLIKVWLIELRIMKQICKIKWVLYMLDYLMEYFFIV